MKKRWFPSVGLGYDYRLEGPGVVGSALMFEGSVIHLALFRVDRDERFDDKTGYLKRRELACR